MIVFMLFTMNKIKVTRKEFVNLLSNYNIGKLLSYRRFKKGQAHTNYFLKTHKGEFVCKIYNNRTEKQILCELEILKKLNQNNFPCIKIFKTNSGNPFFIIKNRMCILYVFVEGNQINKPNLAQFNTAASTLAKLHKVNINHLSKDCDVKKTISKQEILASTKIALKELKDDNLAKERLNWFAGAIKIINEPHANIPSGIIHGDYSQENILFDEDKIAAVIDFDGGSYGAFIFDVASIIYFWIIALRLLG